MTPSAAQDRPGTPRDAATPRAPRAEQEAARLEELAADARREVLELQALVAERAIDADRLEAAVRALRGEHAPSVQGLPSSQPVAFFGGAGLLAPAEPEHWHAAECGPDCGTPLDEADDETDEHPSVVHWLLSSQASMPAGVSTPPQASESSTCAPLQDGDLRAERTTPASLPSQSSTAEVTPPAAPPAGEASPEASAEVTNAASAPSRAEPPHLVTPPVEVASASSPSLQASSQSLSVHAAPSSQDGGAPAPAPTPGDSGASVEAAPEPASKEPTVESTQPSSQSLRLSALVKGNRGLEATRERIPCPDCGRPTARSGLSAHRGGSKCTPKPRTKAAKPAPKAPSPKPASPSAPSGEATPAPATDPHFVGGWGSGRVRRAACDLCGAEMPVGNLRRHRGSANCQLRQKERAAGVQPVAPPTSAAPTPAEPEPPRRPLAPAPERYVAPSRRAVDSIPSVMHGAPVPRDGMREALTGMTRSIAAARERVDGGGEVTA